MSAIHEVKVWGTEELTTVQRLLMLALSSMCGPDGKVSCTVRELADRAHITTRSYYRNMPTLIEKGYVERVEQSSEDGTQMPNLYVVFPNDV